MTSNKSMADRIIETKAELERQRGRFAPPKFPSLPKPNPKSYEPDQKEMDKLASILTEAVLQLRAGDIEGARKKLSDVDHLCGIRIAASTTQPIDHYMDALKYGAGVIKHEYVPPERVMTATEVQLRQEVAQQRIREILDNLSNV